MCVCVHMCAHMCGGGGKKGNDESWVCSFACELTIKKWLYFLQKGEKEKQQDF